MGVSIAEAYSHIVSLLDIEVMECTHRPINVRESVIKTANLGLKRQLTQPTPTSSITMVTDTATAGDSSTIAMDTEMEGRCSEVVGDVKNAVDVSGSHGNTMRTHTVDNPDELNYPGSVTMTTAQPANNIVGHTGYLTFATLPPR